MKRGFDIKIFLSSKRGEIEAFICPSCNRVAKDPVECQCGSVYCSICWKIKTESTCENKCSVLKPEFSRALKIMYNNLHVEWKGIQKNLTDFINEKHRTCGLSECDAILENEELKFCSDECELVNLIKKCDSNWFKAVDEVHKFIRDRPRKEKPLIQDHSKMAWDDQFRDDSVKIEGQGLSIFLNESSFKFYSAVSSQILSTGVNFWQIKAESIDDEAINLKIGVTLEREFDYKTCFSDYGFGFAFYSEGELRHNSDKKGPRYGRKVSNNDLIGCCLDMNEGTLSFSLNDEYLGVAFKSDMLRNGPIYPAISILKKGKCTFIPRKELPREFFERLL